jgi:hypothetical protein
MCYYTQPFVVAIFSNAINGAFINLTTFVVHLLLPVGVVDQNGNSPATVLPSVSANLASSTPQSTEIE